MNAKTVNLISSLGKAADLQANPAKPGTDISSAKEVAPKKTGAADNAAQPRTDSQPPQLFEHALTKANAAQKPDAKASTEKTKAVSDDSEDGSSIEQPASPDVALLMSLLPALPPSGQQATTGDPAAVAPAQDDAIAALAVSPDASGRAKTAPTTDNKLALPLMSSTSDASRLPAPAADTAAASSLPTAVESRLDDKPNLFSSVLKNLEAAAAATAPAPVLATPSHQAPTLSAAAQAVPLTAPGSLDELPISHREWPAALGHSMLWAVGEGIQKVELSVSPQDMGPINVHIRLENDKADIRFTAAHATTRDALEASIPRLRDMFSQQGLNLSQAQVFSQTSQDTRGRQQDNPQAQGGARSDNAAEAQEPELAKPVYLRRGLVDDYA